jgi:hypothetical protein
MRSLWLGYDEREAEAFAVARRSFRRHAPGVPIQALCLDDLREAGLYRRPTSHKDGMLWDDISEAPMSTQFAISRFLAPVLAGTGWALFADCDVMAVKSLDALWAQLDPSKAVMCVQHENYTPPDKVKMDGQLQTLYARKNWSSVMAVNCDHPANKALTVDYINTVPGRDLHAFRWLNDSDIGALTPDWNYLVGVTKRLEPSLIHWTSGGPWFPKYRDVQFADIWLKERAEWLTEGVPLRMWMQRQADDKQPDLPFHDRWVQHLAEAGI